MWTREGRSGSAGGVTESGNAEMMHDGGCGATGLCSFGAALPLPAGILDFVVRFILDGLTTDEPVLVAVPGDELKVLRAADCARRAWIAPALQLVRQHRESPATRAGSWRGGLLRRGISRSGGSSFQPTPPGPAAPRTSLLACEQHEALVNGAFVEPQDHGVVSLRREPAGSRVVDSARATHPLLWRCGSVLSQCRLCARRRAGTLQPAATSQSRGRHLHRPGVADLRTARSFAVTTPGRSDSPGRHRGSAVDRHRVGHQQLDVHQRGVPAGLLAAQRPSGLRGARQRMHQGSAGRTPDRRPRHRQPRTVSGQRDGGLVRTHTTTTGTTIQAYLRLQPLAESRRLRPPSRRLRGRHPHVLLRRRLPRSAVLGAAHREQRKCAASSAASAPILLVFLALISCAFRFDDLSRPYDSHGRTLMLAPAACAAPKRPERRPISLRRPARASNVGLVRLLKRAVVASTRSGV